MRLLWVASAQIAADRVLAERGVLAGWIGCPALQPALRYVDRALVLKCLLENRGDSNAALLSTALVYIKQFLNQPAQDGGDLVEHGAGTIAALSTVLRNHQAQHGVVIKIGNIN